MSTGFDRTIRVRSEQRLVYIDGATTTTTKERTIIVQKENRVVLPKRETTALDRTIRIG
tara:strand:- start:3462 stop:3638 length:177 start_codon:yes stop_codon:yes gene_type:complete